MNLNNSISVELREITSIRPYERNPRLNDKAVDAVAGSLREFGFRQPIVVDAEGVIIAGHTRYKAALKLGLQKVPVHIATDLTPEQVKAYRIADNQTGDIAEWDMEILPIEISELQESGFDMGILSFSDKELTQLLNVNIERNLTTKC
jgi:ParB-like chromosome segregation protein Spo0J